MKFDKHIFICTNQRAPGAARPSCGEAHGMEIVEAFKKKLKERELTIKVRAQRAGCLDVWMSVTLARQLWYIPKVFSMLVSPSAM